MSYVRGVRYLGYSFYVLKGKGQLAVHPKSKAKMKSKLKEQVAATDGDMPRENRSWKNTYEGGSAIITLPI